MAPTFLQYCSKCPTAHGSVWCWLSSWVRYSSSGDGAKSVSGVAEGKENLTVLQLFKAPQTSAPGSPVTSLAREFGGGVVSTAPGLGIFFDKVGAGGDVIPKVFTQFVRKFHSRPEVVVFFHLRTLTVPTVPMGERFVITRVHQLASCYRITLRHGYTDEVLTTDLRQVIVDQLNDFVGRMGKQQVTGHTDQSEFIKQELSRLSCAGQSELIYVLGKQMMRPQHTKSSLIRRTFRHVFLEIFLWLRENTRAKLADIKIDPDNLVEVGWVKHI